MDPLKLNVVHIARHGVDRSLDEGRVEPDESGDEDSRFAFRTFVRKDRGRWLVRFCAVGPEGPELNLFFEVPTRDEAFALLLRLKGPMLQLCGVEVRE